MDKWFDKQKTIREKKEYKDIVVLTIIIYTINWESLKINNLMKDKILHRMPLIVSVFKLIHQGYNSNHKINRFKYKKW